MEHQNDTLKNTKIYGDLLKVALRLQIPTDQQFADAVKTAESLYLLSKELEKARDQAVAVASSMMTHAYLASKGE